VTYNRDAAWALSTDNDMPPCSDQPRESVVAHAKAAAAMAIFLALIVLMGVLHK
jgi:hypothetical protein